MLAKTERRAKRERLSFLRIYEEVRNRSSDDSHDSVCRCAASRPKATLAGEVKFRKKLSREQFRAFMAAQPEPGGVRGLWQRELLGARDEGAWARGAADCTAVCPALR
jgi:hypothetical protein